MRALRKWTARVGLGKIDGKAANSQPKRPDQLDNSNHTFALDSCFLRCLSFCLPPPPYIPTLLPTLPLPRFTNPYTPSLLPSITAPQAPAPPTAPSDASRPGPRSSPRPPRRTWHEMVGHQNLSLRVRFGCAIKMIIYSSPVQCSRTPSAVPPTPPGAGQIPPGAWRRSRGTACGARPWRPIPCDT